MIITRANALFDVNEFVLARFHKTLRVWWLRGLQTKEDCGNLPSSLDSFLQYLRWNIEDGEWFDRCGISIYMYTVACNNISVLRELLHKLKSSNESKLYTKRLRGEAPAKGVTSVGITGKITTLVTAMILANSECVSLLLEHGAEPYECDIGGHDSLMVLYVRIPLLTLQYPLIHQHTQKQVQTGIEEQLKRDEARARRVRELSLIHI